MLGGRAPLQPGARFRARGARVQCRSALERWVSPCSATACHHWTCLLGPPCVLPRRPASPGHGPGSPPACPRFTVLSRVCPLSTRASPHGFLAAWLSSFVSHLRRLSWEALSPASVSWPCHVSFASHSLPCPGGPWCVFSVELGSRCLAEAGPAPGQASLSPNRSSVLGEQARP